MTRPRAILAIEPVELELLFSPAARGALAMLADVCPTGEDPTRLPVDIGHTSDLLITSWSTEPFPVERLRGPRLRLAIHAGGSVRALYPPAALALGLRLTQAGAQAMAPAVAEFAITLTLMLLRNIHQHDRRLQARVGWEASGHGQLGDSLASRRVGIVGLGRAGQTYLRAVTALGARRPLVYDPFADPAHCRRLGGTLVSLDEVFSSCNLVAVHAPLTPATRGLVGAAQLSALCDDAILVNTARAGLVDQDALQRELVSGRLRGGLDVFPLEPLTMDSPLIGLPNVVLTPHVAGGTVQARHSQGDAVVEEVTRFVRGLDPLTEVTPARYAQLA